MNVNKDQFLNELKKVMPGVSGDNLAHVGMDTVILDENGLHSFNDQITVSVVMDLGGINCAVKGVKLFKILQKTKLSEIELSQSDEGLVIKAGTTITTLKKIGTDSIKRIADIKNVPDRISLPSNFVEGLSLCLLKGNDNDNTGGVYINGDMLLSTDGYGRIASFKMDSSFVGDDLFISQKNCEELLKIPSNLIKYVVYKSAEQSWVHFETEDNTLFSCTLLKTSFFEKYKDTVLANYDLKADNGLLKGVFPKQIKEVASTAEILATKDFITGTSIISLTFTQDSYIIEAESDAGNIKDEIKSEVPFNITEPIVLYYPTEYICDIIDKTEGFFLIEKVYKNGKATPLVLHNSNFKYSITNID